MFLILLQCYVIHAENKDNVDESSVLLDHTKNVPKNTPTITKKADDIGKNTVKKKKKKSKNNVTNKIANSSTSSELTTKPNKSEAIPKSNNLNKDLDVSNIVETQKILSDKSDKNADNELDSKTNELIDTNTDTNTVQDAVSTEIPLVDEMKHENLKSIGTLKTVLTKLFPTVAEFQYMSNQDIQAYTLDMLAVLYSGKVNRRPFLITSLDLISKEKISYSSLCITCPRYVEFDKSSIIRWIKFIKNSWLPDDKTRHIERVYKLVLESPENIKLAISLLEPYKSNTKVQNWLKQAKMWQRAYEELKLLLLPNDSNPLQ